MKDEKETSICITHRERELRYACLDPECNESPEACIICLKKQHKNCKSKFIISNQNILKNFEFSTFETNMIQHSKNSIKDITDLMLAKLIFKIRDILNIKLKKIKYSENIDLNNIPNEHLVEAVKNNFNFTISPKPHLTSKLLGFESTLDKNFEAYEVELLTFLAEFCQKLSGITFGLQKNLLLSDFLFSKRIFSEDNCGKLQFTKDLGLNSYNGVIYKNPLDENTFKITIKNIDQNDRFLDIGILNQTFFDSIKSSQDFIVSFYGAGTFSFCGYSYSNVNGKTATTDSSSPNGHDFNKEYFLNFSKSLKSLRIYDSEMKTDLKNDNSLPDMNYYFYVVLYHKSSCCIVTLI